MIAAILISAILLPSLRLVSDAHSWMYCHSTKLSDGPSSFQVETEDHLGHTQVMLQLDNVRLWFRHEGREPLPPPGWIRVEPTSADRQGDSTRLDLYKDGEHFQSVPRERGQALDLTPQQIADIIDNGVDSMALVRDTGAVLRQPLTTAHHLALAKLLRYGKHCRINATQSRGATAFIVDASHSMVDEFSDARELVLEAVRDTSPDDKLIVGTFADTWNVSANRGGVLATVAHRDRIEQMLSRPVRSRDSSQALLAVVRNALDRNMMTIVVVTDGQLELSEEDGEKLLSLLRRRHARLNIAIVGLVDDNAASPELLSVCNATDGVVRYYEVSRGAWPVEASVDWRSRSVAGIATIVIAALAIWGVTVNRCRKNSS